MNTITSQTKPGDCFTAPLRVVLHESHASTAERPEYVTHLENMQGGGKFWGHYFRDEDPATAYAEAVADYKARCVKLGVPAEVEA